MRVSRSVPLIFVALLLAPGAHAPGHGATLPPASQSAQKLIGAPMRAQAGATSTAGDRIYQITKLHRIHIHVAPGEWQVLQTSTPRGGAAAGVRPGDDYRDASGRLIHIGGGFGGYFPWTSADIRIEEHGAAGKPLEFRNVGLRYKGNFTFQRSSASAPLFASFKLKLDVHGTRGRWDEVKTFNLHAGVIDTSKMRETIAYALFREAGVPAPRTAHVELFFTVPGLYTNTPAGLFTLVEDVNNTFLERALPPGDGLLMKPEGSRGGVQQIGTTWEQFTAVYRPDRDATPAEQRRMLEFTGLISQTDVALFRSRINEYLDVETFLRFIAINAMIANTDSYLGGNHNYYLYLDPRDNRFRFLPWDQDLSMNARAMIGGGSTTSGGGPDLLRPWTGDQPLIYWLLDDPKVAARYREILRELGTTVFTAPRLLALVDTLEKIGSGRGPSPRGFLEARAAYVQDVVGRLFE